MTLFYHDDDYSFLRSSDYKNFFRNERKFNDSSSSFFFLKKTGTTICGILYNGGIILGCDTRATNGELICDLNCEKIHFLSPCITCCGAGTSADTENLTKLVSNQLGLSRVSYGRESRVKTAVSILQKILFKHQGFLSAALIVGGFDFLGYHLYSIYPHGSSENVPFAALGSGSLAALAILEKNFEKNLELANVIFLMEHSIKAGIYNDTGSGGSIDICILTKKKISVIRNKKLNSSFNSKANFYFN